MKKIKEIIKDWKNQGFSNGDVLEKLYYEVEAFSHWEGIGLADFLEKQYPENKKDERLKKIS